MKFKIKIEKERCKGCALCIEVCARKILAVSGSLNKAGAHFAAVVPGGECVGCLNCAVICPDAAIEIEPADKVE